MKNLIPIILVLLSINVFGQQKTKWLNSLENPKSRMFQKLKKGNLLNRYLKYDLSDVLVPKTDFLGFIGTDFRRIKINYSSIKKSTNTSNLYFITGTTKVGDNICDFEGTITIEQFREFENMHYGIDDKYADAGFKAQGIAIGKYLFNENPEQKFVGTFEGIMTVWWYVNKNGEIKFDDLETYSDNYKNNQYAGNWTQYGKTKSKICNWGEYRIPFSEGLDEGTGEFSPNPYSKGWEDFYK
ncbi:hypothetical protein [Reichenbachiella versicolor]|uniref:hypothetical protein n=1 Tax=Reichenbachiella versicolor TaxID=1821036 RepID=UPI0013A58B34|nr:hypothetical protein [Reichenbachiella versicolor]